MALGEGARGGRGWEPVVVGTASDGGRGRVPVAALGDEAGGGWDGGRRRSGTGEIVGAWGRGQRWTGQDERSGRDGGKFWQADGLYSDSCRDLKKIEVGGALYVDGTMLAGNLRARQLRLNCPPAWM